MPGEGNATDRRPGEYLLFGVAFVGFVIAMSGVIVSSGGLAGIGAALTLLALLCLVPRAPAEG